MSAEYYWPLTDAVKSGVADEPLRNQDGAYQSSNAGAGTNDEGALVPVFKDSSDEVSVPWINRFNQSVGSMTCWIN